jgi:hypothetical protein
MFPRNRTPAKHKMTYLLTTLYLAFANLISKGFNFFSDFILVFFNPMAVDLLLLLLLLVVVVFVILSDFSLSFLCLFYKDFSLTSSLSFLPLSVSFKTLFVNFSSFFLSFTSFLCFKNETFNSKSFYFISKSL